MMTIRALLALAMVGTVSAGCAQGQETPPAQQAGQPQAASSQQVVTSCWTRENASGLSARESAFDSASVSVGGQTIKVCYGRPQMRGRTIMGGLVPYGQPWRLGANEATAIHMPTAGSIAGVPVQAGSYSLYVVPNANEWRVFVNRNAQRWGVPINSGVTGNDIGSGTIVPETINQPVEALTARFDGVTATGAALVFEWERTRVRIPVTLTR